MTHSYLVSLADRHLRGTRRCDIVLTEKGTTREIPDAIGWGPGGSVLVECKTSIEDFRADQRKPSRRAPHVGIGQFRYYLTPKGLLSGQTLPEGWGLLEVRGTRVFTIITAVKQENWNLDNEFRLILRELCDWHMVSQFCNVASRTYQEKWRIIFSANQWTGRNT